MLHGFWANLVPPPTWGKGLNRGAKLFQKWILQPKTPRLRYITRLFDKLGNTPPPPFLLGVSVKSWYQINIRNGLGASKKTLY